MEIIIQLSKKKIVLLCFGAIGFVALGLLLLKIADTITSYDPTFVKIISVMGIIFFGLCSIYAFIKLFDNKPGLVINDNGIIDNSSAVSAGLIRWENITNISITEVSGQKILTIEVNNADQILSKQKGLKKLLMNLNKDYFNSPVQISSNALNCNFHQLYNTLKEQLIAHHAS